MLIGSSGKQEAQTLFWSSRRHFERPRWQREWCVEPNLVAPWQLHCVQGVAPRRATERGFCLSLTHMFAHTHRWSPMMHPFSHPFTTEANNLDIRSFTLTVVSLALLHVFPPPVSSLPEEASPVKLHHWHSDHSTYFNSFQVTSSLLLNKWLNRRSPSAAWAPAYRASPHGRVTGIFFRLVTGEPRLETRMNHFGLSHAFCFV